MSVGPAAVFVPMDTVRTSWVATSASVTLGTCPMTSSPCVWVSVCKSLFRSCKPDCDTTENYSLFCLVLQFDVLLVSVKVCMCVCISDLNQVD